MPCLKLTAVIVVCRNRSTTKEVLQTIMSDSKSGQPTLVNLLNEINQSPDARQTLLAKLEGVYQQRCVLLYFTAFNQNAPIGDKDADAIEGVLQKSDLSNGLSLIINSPGGDGLAAERIINVCCSYSNGDFEAIVPKMAKSAATMICFGAKKLRMGKTSELGPIDPQIYRNGKYTAAHNIVTSYEQLLKDAVATQGNVEPYLQQLQRYDASEIMDIQLSQDLAISIAERALQSGMMQGEATADIRTKIQTFTDPTQTSSHGRMIGLEAAKSCGLNVEEIMFDSDEWSLLWELYVRAEYYVSSKASKLIETKNHSFEVSSAFSEAQ